jgi:hypothetical protein
MWELFLPHPVFIEKRGRREESCMQREEVYQ